MNLVTDRTEADVLLGTNKGRYTYEDLNRVETAVQLLCSLAESTGIDLALTVKTDWGATEDFSTETWPTTTQMERYLGNVYAICEALGVQEELPKTMAYLDTQGANSIEKALENAYSKIQEIIQDNQVNGIDNAGEESAQ